MKSKICVVADVPNWAFDSIAQKLKKGLSDKYEIRIAYFNRRTEAEFFYEFIEQNNDCDLIHFLNRRMLLLIGTEIFKEKVEANGKNYDEYVKEKQTKFSTAVYDYMDLDEIGILEHQPIFNTYTKKYYTATKKLFDIYNSISEFNKPTALVHDICDTEIFKPTNLERFNYNNIIDREIVVGWVGNSIHNDEKEVDLKGFRTILNPVIKELQQEGYNIRGNYADRNVKWISPSEMPSYYASIDICICVSVHEGTPRPVLEAMNSGIPIISTDVGIVSEAFGTKQQEFIIGDRNNGKNDEYIRKQLKEKIIYLYNNRNLFNQLSKENIESIEKFDGGKTIKDFEKFFDNCLSE